MPDTPISMCRPRDSLPKAELKKPFATLLDSRDPEWSDAVFLSSKSAELFDMGCRYYVCFGPRAEFVHDSIDDEILKKISEEDCTTTFHDDEAAEDVATFFQVVAMRGMTHGLLLVNDSDWLAKL